MITANIVVIGAFAGYAGGGGLSNSTYSNFVRDKGWGMGSTSARSQRHRPARLAQPRGQGLPGQRHNTPPLVEAVAVSAAGPGRGVGPRVLHGDGPAGLAVSGVRPLLNIHRGKARMVSVAHHG